ncbi:MAG: uracil-DNA glycosylase [Betaproteobacteria bacterium]|nr:uracil-DNA glycosylase [Betaproteobacteria bacterium]
MPANARPDPAAYDASCTRCDRLAGFLSEVGRKYPAYFCKPVPPFGDARPKLLIVGLAPGMHGANASGRPFTGDHAGILLYQTLHAFGFATAAESLHANDDLRLVGCRISNAVKCLPPQNKPTPAEIRTCNSFLQAEIAALPADTVILALGGIAHNAVLMACGLKVGAAKFGHGTIHELPKGQMPQGRWLFDSYHCSRYNTNTRRLTEATFHSVFEAIRRHLA